MNWPEVRQAHPDHWLIIEALEAHTEGQQRIFDQIAVIETCADGARSTEQAQSLQAKTAGL